MYKLLVGFFTVLAMMLVGWSQFLKHDIEERPDLTYESHLVSCYKTTIGKKSHRREANACLFRMGEDYQELHYSDLAQWEARKLEVGNNVEVTVWDHRPQHIKVALTLAFISAIIGLALLFLFRPNRRHEESYYPE